MNRPGWSVAGHRAHHRRRPYRALAVAVALLLSATAIGLAGRPDAAVWWGTPLSATAQPATAQPALPPAAAQPDPAAPTRLSIPRIGVDTGLQALHLDDRGALEAPHTFTDAGWYADGTAPGDIGPAVIAGHVDSRTGPAVFFRLHELHAGDLVRVARGTRLVSFTVVAVHRYPKNAFPTFSVYGPTPDAQLRLITCGGSFDQARHSYLDNVIVYGVIA